MEAICHDLNFNWKKIAPESAKSKEAVTLKNQFMFSEGTFVLKNWLAFGFLVCCHDDVESLQFEFWQLINP